MSINSNIQIFNSWAYATTRELVSQQIELFNAATRNAIVLRPAADNTGDYSDVASWALIGNAVRRRDPYDNSDVAATDLAMLLNTSVKVAAGQGPHNLPPVMFNWINQDPKAAAVKFAQDLAPYMMQDMLNVAISAAAAALAAQAANFLDVSGGSGGAELFNPSNIVLAKAKLGDRSGAIAAWVVHSKPMHNYWGNAVANAEQLYTYGTINVVSDPFGAPMIMADVPSLVIAGAPTDYVTLGLVPGAIVVEQNRDFESNIETSNGGENIRRTMQSEWSYNLGLKGMTWDKANGGSAPTNAALSTGSNWDKTATSFKDLPGVALRTQ